MDVLSLFNCIEEASIFNRGFGKVLSIIFDGMNIGSEQFQKSMKVIIDGMQKVNLMK